MRPVIMLWLWLFWLMPPNLAYAAPRVTEDILPMGSHTAGTAQSSNIAVLPGDRYVTMRLDRSAWNVVAGVLTFTVEAETGGVWREIKRQETHGKAVGTSAPSGIFISIPADATQVRGKVLVGAPPGTYRVWIEVGS